MIYYAKSKQKNGNKPTVAEHLLDVSLKAGEYGGEIDLRKESETAGKLHDFGKYSSLFQQVLIGTASNVDHASAGALYLYRHVQGQKRKIKGPVAIIPIMEAIHGHHNGLSGWEHFVDDFYRVKNDGIWYKEWEGKQCSIQSRDQYKEAADAFKSDFPDFRRPDDLAEPPLFYGSFADHIRNMLYTRMLFSCLVDADYSVSAHEADVEGENYFETSEKTEFDVSEALRSLYAYRQKIKRASTADPSVNSIRDSVFDACGDAGDGEEGLYTLTAPTGTGKTLALLHFALRHCLKTGKRRIILVLPFLTLAEQNTGVYRSMIPEILEDHSQSNLPDSMRELTARWRMPFIVTTSVKFFESLFSSAPTDCRKLHNIANSVVVFDEAQSLPADLTVSTLNAVNELCRRWHVTMLFSTATQPDYDAIPELSWKPTEILQNNRLLYQSLKRTSIDWRIGTGMRSPFASVAREMAAQTNVCAIVNLRRHAVRLYGLLKEIIPDKNALYLISTDLCPEHRKKVVKTIKDRQMMNLPCYVVATQCIEAGVDLDFDALFRALAPLEAIIQAAGRCNRNGRKENGGRVIVFIPDEEKLYPDSWYERGADTVRRMFLDYERVCASLDIHSPDVIRDYYRVLFGSQKEKTELVHAVEARDFKDVDRQYRLIADRGVHVLVPYSEKRELFETVKKRMISEGLSTVLIKEAAMITVTSFEKNVQAWCIPVQFRTPQGADGSTDWYVLDNESLYREDTGLQFALPSDTRAADFSPFL